MVASGTGEESHICSDKIKTGTGVVAAQSAQCRRRITVKTTHLRESTTSKAYKIIVIYLHSEFQFTKPFAISALSFFHNLTPSTRSRCPLLVISGNRGCGDRQILEPTPGLTPKNGEPKFRSTTGKFWSSLQDCPQKLARNFDNTLLSHQGSGDGKFWN